MEILGIVWAASIITPAPIAATAADHVGQQLESPPVSSQQPVPFEATASRLSSLADAYGWATSTLEAEAAFGSYADSARWLVPHLSTIRPSGNGSRSYDAPFTALVPAIGQGLTSFEIPLTASANFAEPEETPSSSWHSWNAVASVRLEEDANTRITPINEQLEFDPVCLRDAVAPYQTSSIAMKAASKTQLWVQNHFIGDLAGQVTASKIAEKLRTLIQQGELEPDKLHPMIGSNFVGVGHQNDVLFVVDETMQSHPEVPATVTAVQWINNLRSAFDEQPLGLADVQMATKGLAETSEALYGTASWYGPGFHGRKTANGEIYDQNALTAAHKSLPFNTHLKITNRLNGKSVVVRINDRGPYIGDRSIDLSKAAAYCLGSTVKGVVPYEAVILKPLEKPDLDELTTAWLQSE